MRAVSPLVALLFALNVGVIRVRAEQSAPESSLIRVQGRADVVVTEPMVRFGDIAQIDSPNLQDDEAIIQIRKIVVGKSPKAGEITIVDGARVLERLQEEGVRLSSLRYSLPRQITITRAYREVQQDELERALSAFLTKSARQIDVRQLITEKPVKIPADSLGLEVVALETTKPGHIGVDFKSIAGSDEVRFQLRAVADEWRLMPVAAKPLTKGSIISASDIQLQKMNGTSVGKDVLENIGDVVGRTVARDVGQGEMFRSNSVMIPAVISSGSRVTLLFREKLLEATAGGVALENGALGQEIKVRNEQSKKVVIGRVTESGLVTVGAE